MMQGRCIAGSFFITIIILLTMLITLRESSVKNMIMPEIATNASFSKNPALYTTGSGPSSSTLSTNSTPPTITDTTDASSSIDLYHVWLKKFTASSMGFPLPDVVATPEMILETQWALELWSHLSELDTKYVSLCIGNYAYIESIVNWLIAALVITQPPLENVLVISLDTKLHEFLQGHDINSVYVDMKSILRGKQTMLWVTRLVLFRLINHWGYTVATYDSDAIPVRNPQTLFAQFEDSNVVGSRGTYPFDLKKKWKYSTMCLGMVLFKASKETEAYWNFLSSLKIESFDDQFIINTGFDKCGIKWNINSKQSSIIGRCSNALDLKISLVSTDDICRICKNHHKYYVWHQLSDKVQGQKKTAAKEGGLWFLKQNYLDHTVKFKGLQWLRFLNSD